MSDYDALIPGADSGGGSYADLVPEKKKHSFVENAIGSIIEPIAAMGSGAAAKPISELLGLGALTTKLLPEGMGYSGDPLALQQKVQGELTYQPKTAAGTSSANPLNLIPQLLGQAVNWGANKVAGAFDSPDAGPVRQALVSGIAEAGRQAPQLIGARAPGVGTAVKNVLQGENRYIGARGMMESALKPDNEAFTSGQAADAITTMLDKGINVSKGGLEKLKPMIDDLDNQVSAQIAGSSATIDPMSVGTRLASTLDKFKKQVLRGEDIATIKRAWSDFLDEYQTAIPIQEAQQIKQGTYRRLEDRAYSGEPQLSAKIAAQKDLARGFKEDIAAAEPGIEPLNAELSKLLNVQNLIEPRVYQEARQNPIGWGVLNPKTLLIHALDRSSPAKSAFARLLNATGEVAPGTAAAIGPGSGIAVTGGAEDAARKRLIAELLMGSQ